MAAAGVGAGDGAAGDGDGEGLVNILNLFDAEGHVLLVLTTTPGAVFPEPS